MVNALDQSSYWVYCVAHQATLFKDKPRTKLITVSRDSRAVSGYQAMLHGTLTTFTEVSVDAGLGILHNGAIVAMPAVSEFDVVLRSLPELFDHCGQLFRCWPDVGVFQGLVVRPRQPVDGDHGDPAGGLFAAYYILCARNFDDGTFRIVRLLLIGTVKAELEDETSQEWVATWTKYGVTQVCEKKFDADSCDVEDVPGPPCATSPTTSATAWRTPSTTTSPTRLPMPVPVSTQESS